MTTYGAEVYDQDDFLEAYLQRRNRDISPNNLIEKPILLDLIGNIREASILDLGCGDGRFGTELINAGCASYHGIDQSKKMIDLAEEQNNHPNIHFSHRNIEGYDLEERSYDLVISRLVFHYLESLEDLFARINNSLKPRGRLIFSVEHPIITSHYESYQSKKKRHEWVVSKYFVPGPRINHWLDHDVVKYHRTFEEYFDLFDSADYELISLKEAKPKAEQFRDEDELNRRTQVPLFLICSLRKKP